MSINSESTPPPVIGKIGPYTVFMTPPSTPKPSDDNPVTTTTTTKIFHHLVYSFEQIPITFPFTAHSSLDDHLARWFGLNQSKYQWALDDYYESKGVEKGDIKVKEISSKVQSV
ncbi:hypothetical protein glysoja_005802 [Glycine soja]|nr:hypothetical protein glysoja_005802 [Glycine soja]